MEKIKDSEVKHVVLGHLHMVKFMSINPSGTIDDFKTRGKEMVVESFDICVAQISFILNPLHFSPNQIELCTICIRKKTPTDVLKVISK
jgi:hypothetical protein